MTTAVAADAVIKGGAASTLLYFLDSKKDSLEPAELGRIFATVTASVLKETSDFSLLNCVKKYGWNEISGRYDDTLKIEALSIDLRKIIGRRDKKPSTLRSSQVGVRNTIKAFVPDILMIHTLEERLHAEAGNLTPFSIFFDGVCLLADISGFTSLSSAFCAEGLNGLDQLQQATSGYLGQLVKIIYAYGGDVMKFAGDALVCVFRSGSHGPSGRKTTVAEICSHAMLCATELAQVCTDKLTVHVAMSCGPICFAMIGGYNNLWECLVSGPCFGHLSSCLNDAASKQTVVSRECIDMLTAINRDELNIEKLPSGNYRVISAVKMASSVVQKIIKRRGDVLMKDSESRFIMYPNDDEFLTALLHFVPMPVSVGLLSGSFDYLAELREVTTMFMSWDSYDEVEHKDLLTLQVFLVAAQKVLVQTGGFIRQFLVDDKGCVLIACWGVPTASYPDNSRRALCAGAIIGYELSKLGMRTSVGITTGNVFCGSIGSYVRREYAVIGDVVNLSARLMSKANGGLYMDEATYDRIPPFLQEKMNVLTPMAFKGKDILVTPYILRQDVIPISFGDKDETDFDKNIRSVCKLPLVENMDIISTTKDPVPLKFVLIEGKMGTGKVEVVNWLKLAGPRKNVRIVSILLNSREAAVDYSMVAQLFRLLVSESVYDNAESQQIMVRKILTDIYKDDKETAEKVSHLLALNVIQYYLVSCSLYRCTIMRLSCSISDNFLFNSYSARVFISDFMYTSMYDIEITDSYYNNANYSN